MSAKSSPYGPPRATIGPGAPSSAPHGGTRPKQGMQYLTPQGSVAGGFMNVGPVSPVYVPSGVPNLVNVQPNFPMPTYPGVVNGVPISVAHPPVSAPVVIGPTHLPVSAPVVVGPTAVPVSATIRSPHHPLSVPAVAPVLPGDTTTTSLPPHPADLNIPAAQKEPTESARAAQLDDHSASAKTDSQTEEPAEKLPREQEAALPETSLPSEPEHHSLSTSLDGGQEASSSSAAVDSLLPKMADLQARLQQEFGGDDIYMSDDDEDDSTSLDEEERKMDEELRGMISPAESPQEPLEEEEAKPVTLEESSEQEAVSQEVPAAPEAAVVTTSSDAASVDAAGFAASADAANAASADAANAAESGQAEEEAASEGSSPVEPSEPVTEEQSEPSAAAAADTQDCEESKADEELEAASDNVSDKPVEVGFVETPVTSRITMATEAPSSSTVPQKDDSTSPASTPCDSRASPENEDGGNEGGQESPSETAAHDAGAGEPDSSETPEQPHKKIRTRTDSICSEQSLDGNTRGASQVGHVHGVV